MLVSDTNSSLCQRPAVSLRAQGRHGSPQRRRVLVLKLFYAVGTCALASHIALEEAGAEYDAVRLELRTNDQRKPEYLAINPKGRGPGLVTDDGVLTETPAILAFVAQSFPRAGLAPTADPLAFACVQAFNSYLC